MIRNYKIVVKGKVQGVGFRQNAQAMAHKYNLTGFVKNMHDKSVLVQAQGKDENIQRFIEWCNTGPRLAEVVEVLTEEIQTGNFTTFEIKK